MYIYTYLNGGYYISKFLFQIIREQIKLPTKKSNKRNNKNKNYI